MVFTLKKSKKSIPSSQQINCGQAEQWIVSAHKISEHGKKNNIFTVHPMVNVMANSFLLLILTTFHNWEIGNP